MFDRSSHKPVLITGATGFLGSYILRWLCREGIKCRAMKRSTSSMELVQDVVDQVDWVIGDMTDYDSLLKATDGIQAIIHAAAIVDFRKSMRKRLIKVNAGGTRDLVNIALEKDLAKFIYISSVSTMGRNPDKPLIDEDCTFNFGPLDTGYAISKHLGEMEVWRAGAEGLNMVIVNPSIILGSGFWDAGSCKIFKHAWNGIPFYPSGCSGFVDVRDVSRMTCSLLMDEIRHERFICSTDTVKQKELLELICQKMGKNPPRFKLNPILGRLGILLDKFRSLVSNSSPVITAETLKIAAHCFEFDNSKSKEMLGFEYTPLETTIEETTNQFVEAAEDGYAPKALPLN